MDCIIGAGTAVSEPLSEIEVLGALRAMEGVTGAELLDDGASRRVISMEREVCRGACGLRIENRGMEEVSVMGTMYVLFCDARFSRPDGITMEMVSDNGEIVGHDVPESMRARLEARDDLIWMSEGFVMFPGRIGCRDARMVMLSSRLRVPGLPDGLEARLFYPSTSTAEYIGGLYGVSDRRLAKVVVGVGRGSVPVADVVQVSR